MFHRPGMFEAGSTGPRRGSGPRSASLRRKPSTYGGPIGAAPTPARGSAERWPDAAIRPAPESSTARRSTSRWTSRGCATCFSLTWRRRGSEARDEETAANRGFHQSPRYLSPPSHHWRRVIRLLDACGASGRDMAGDSGHEAHEHPYYTRDRRGIVATDAVQD